MYSYGRLCIAVEAMYVCRAMHSCGGLCMRV